MPIYEFKCMKCSEVFEILCVGGDDKAEMVCPKCKCEDVERVMSSSNYAMGSGKGAKVASTTRSCSSGSCTTWEVPGHSK